ncbi:DUF3667 domain-containing protein [Pedobacter chinensis]|uniref:DUF3667 domain-containing protein n=1 Tax=Pedobacter chinensis TaxID=2282421 RepID=A0A369PT62_9SPHI|nr:DUF3667 domain-containing protein [Pedobacter chinensis]
MNCKACSTEVTSKYCPNCGQPSLLKRIDGHYIAHEIEHVLHFDKGILYTIRELLIRPGSNIRRFILEDRSRLVKPVIFIIVTSLIYTIVSHFFHIDSIVTYDLPHQSTSGKIYKWTEDHLGYSNMIMGAFIALWIKLFFRKNKYNYFEIIILLCFVMGMGMLIFTLFAILEGVTHFDFKKISAIVSIGYCVWGIGQFFDSKKFMSYVKAFFSYIIGMTTYSVLALAIGSLIDLIFRN